MRSSNSARNPVGRYLRAGLVVVAGSFLSLPLCAVDPGRAMSQYVRDRWGTEQGFPKGPVYAISQTADGYLWIGTDAGLVRFDGWSFRLVKDESGVSTITSVLGLAADNQGCLWLRLQDLTLLRYCDGVFQHPSSDPALNSFLSAMSRGKGGEVLVAKMEDGAFGLREGRLERLASSRDLPRSPVIALAQTGAGEIWLGTRDAGLFRLGSGTQSIRKGLPDPKVNALLADGERSLWVGTDNGIVRWNGSELTSVGIPSSLQRFQALAMVKDRDANIWVGTDSRGLLRFNAQGFNALPDPDPALHEAVTALFEDREGNLWIGRASGIERLRDSAFVTYSQAEGVPAEGANPVFADAGNRIWFAPMAGGLWWLKDGKSGRVSADGLDSDVIYSIAGNKDEVWVGRQRGGLTRLRVQGSSITAHTYRRADGLAQDSVYSVYQARDGSVWAGTLSGGVSKFAGGHFVNFSIANGLKSNTVASILEGSDGTMWFATPGGLTSYSQNHWQTFTSMDGLPNNNINSLLQDTAGTLWIGTASGLAFRNHERFQVPGRLPAALKEQILGLAEDSYGSLWISTASHVLRVNRDKLVEGQLKNADLREYGVADGLRGVEGVKRHRSVITDAAGHIWFSLNRGISMVDPARLNRSSAPALVHIQGILADGNPLGLADVVQVPGGRKRITVTFAGLSLSVPDRVRFRYLLEGFDRNWSEALPTREAAYTNLPPSTYRFRVVASNPEGVWNSNEATITFEVAPLLWQTWWFRLCIVLACAGSILASYRLRVREVSRRLNLRFEERLAERTRIAQDLHDTLLQGFLSASMQVHVAADCVGEDSHAKPILNRALQLMGQVIEEGRNAVRGLRSSQSASLDLEQAFSRIPQEFSLQQQGAEPVAFQVIVEGEQRPLHPLLRDEVYRIGREGLINAFRHARARKIEIELHYSPKDLRIMVRDDGCGIDPQVLQKGREGHFGLRGMRERAERIGGRLKVFQRPTAGTEIELSIPAHAAFQGQPRRKRNWFGYNGHGNVRSREAAESINNEDDRASPYSNTQRR